MTAFEVMPSPLHKALKSEARNSLFQVKRKPLTEESLTGFVVAWSDSLILFHQLEDNVFCLNGYAAVRVRDVSEFRVFDSDEHWQRHATKLKKLKPHVPDKVSVPDWSHLFETVSAGFPLVVISMEKKEPDVCYVGEVQSVSNTAVTTHDLDANCEWQKPKRFRFSDITMVEFGDGYSLALAATAPKRSTD
jgi:hypothetical protein